jgi:hypothetical protein
MSDTKHTPTPWKAEGEGRIYAESDGMHLASVWMRFVSDQRADGESWLEMRERTQPMRDAANAEVHANAAFIVRACNAHEQLIDTLRQGRVAIDVLMAQLIEVDPSFKPTQSAAWPALVAIKAALEKVEA